jgi:hypothetical protein
MLERFAPVLASFESHNVRYVVIGGVAAIAHGVPRVTLDLGILIERSVGNASRLLNALEEAGFGTAALTTPQGIVDTDITLFQDRVLVDVQTKTPGVEFEDAWKEREIAVMRGQSFNILSRRHVISSKLAAGRPVDLEDVRALQATPPDDKPSTRQ